MKRLLDAFWEAMRFYWYDFEPRWLGRMGPVLIVLGANCVIVLAFMVIGSFFR